MRNLKRVLSLALASVMLLGMMVISSSAAEAKTGDFTDKAEITYTEAADVMAALKVFEGDDNGAFNPTGILTREQAAKIVCTMLLGADNAAKLGTNTSIFSDVAASRWSAGYIAYCANLGILAGNGDGTFAPEGQLTGVAFGKMLLVALGYDPAIEGYTGGNWATAIASDMIDAKIDVKGTTLSDPLTREQAAQMALQALQATMVTYANKGTNITMADGTTVVVGASPAAAVGIASEGAANYAGATGAANGENTQQFCEKYFSDLKKDTVGESDDLGRGGYTWQYKGKDVAFVADDTVVVYTANKNTVPGKKAVASDLKGYKFNGVEIKNANTAVGATGGATVGDLTVANSGNIVNAIAALTGNGKTVEIYADKNNNITDVNVITYRVEKVNNVVTNKDGDVTYTLSTSGAKIDYADDYANTDTIVLYGAVAKGDYVTTAAGTSYTHVYPTTSFTGTQTAKTNDGKVTISGEVYTIGSGVTGVGTFNNSTKEAVYYADQFGYVVQTTSTAASTDYAFVIGTNGKLSTTIDGSTPSVEARVLLADGTVAVYTVAVEKLKTGNTLIGTSSANTTPVTLAAGDYVVKGTNICVYDDGTTTNAAGVTTLAGDLNTNAFGYTLSDSTITLETLNAYTGTTAADTVYAASLGAAVNENTTSYTVGGKTVLADKNTVFVVYNADKKTAAVYTGSANLPKATNNETGYAVLKTGASNANLGTASVIFVSTSTGIGADGTTEYVYIDSTKYTEDGSGSDKVYLYNGTSADGTSVSLKSDSLLSASGLYTYNAENKVDESNDKLATTSNTTFTGTPAVYVYDATLTVTGDLLGAANGYYNITEDTQIVYVKTDLSEVNGNGGFVVLASKDGSATANVEAIFITVD